MGGGYVWFDPTTMAIPRPGKLGNCPISSERGPGLEADRHEPVEEVPHHGEQVRGVPFRRDQRVQYADLRGVNGYSTDVFPGGGIDKTKYGVDPTYTASIPTGVVNTSLGARNLQFALKFHF